MSAMADLIDSLTADRDHWRQRAERAEAALSARTAAETMAALAADDAARARLAAERPCIPPTERDRRETSGESDPWAPWREGHATATAGEGVTA